jgi:cytochrome c-type biogenesis protein CcsB
VATGGTDFHEPVNESTPPESLIRCSAWYLRREEIVLGAAFLHAGAVLLLTAAAWAVVRLVRRSDSLDRWPEIVLAAALAALAAFLVTRGATAGTFPATDLAESLALFSILVAVCYLAFIGWAPSADPSDGSAELAEARSLGAFVLPVAAALAIGSAVALSVRRPHGEEFHAVFLALHATSCFAAYAAFAFGSCAGVAYLVQERSLRLKKLGRISRRLPSLSALDAWSYRAVALGFPLLTFGIATGSVWAAREWGSYWLWEPKLTLALLLWLLGAAIFHLRTIQGYQGRRTAILAIASAVMVLIVFLGPSLIRGGMHAFL